ncbi:BREX system serine/threonine kinase PglW [Ectothiorhodospira shaposhnikovii]|uniref:BREX system serine/threonine kinase PglW n=1 Tax=Ectothiorhodospira shaposhnikovii TaxID=1054 RepID=UPI0039A14C46
MDKHWKQVTPSDHAWEQEALNWVRQALPDHEPYRAWANFEFIAQDGSINEVDLLVLTPKGCYLVEIKSHPGAMGGDAGTWIWEKPNGQRKAFDNPRLLADRKARKLASLLQVQPSSKKSKERVPFITALVFLSAENLVSKLEGPAGMGVCTRRDLLPEITDIPEHWPHRPVNRPAARSLARALDEAGIKESVRLRRVGLYELTHLLDESDLFQDWLARHTELGVERKVRIYLVRHRPEPEAQRLQKAAELEYQLLEGIEHPGILKAKEYHHHDHGPALIYEHDPQAQRLDHRFCHPQAQRLNITQAIDLLRQIAEAVKHAHGQRLYHRALSPQNILIRDTAAGGFAIKITHWSTASRIFESETRQVSALSHLTCLMREEAGPYLPPEAHLGEGDGVLMDVFSLGTLAYHLFTGKRPAESDLDLLDKLNRGKGLQITDDINGASTEMQYLVHYATHPDPAQRMDSVDDFLQCLDALEDDLTRPDTQRVHAPTEAREGESFAGGITIRQRLGRGASSVVFLVDHQGHACVLKMAASPDHNARLREEANTLSRLRHQAIVAHRGTIEVDGHVGLLLDHANEGTLAQRLRRHGAVPLELLERFGDDLLSALVQLEEKGIFHRDIKPENLGLTKQGSQLHLVVFDFSLAGISPDNITAGTLAYMDPFIRDAGRRRWDDYAERFAAALTLYEMAAGSLPGWVAGEGGIPPGEGSPDLDGGVFDPAVRDPMTAFFARALVRDVRHRFATAEDMLRDWRRIFAQARTLTRHDTRHDATPCPVDEARPDTQIGLLEMSPQALDVLSRRNINTVAELIRLNRSQVRVWVGVGSQTRRELSDLISRLQARLQTPDQVPVLPVGEAGHDSIDRLFQLILPRPTKATDPLRQRFLNEYLGRLDEPLTGTGPRAVHWPTPLSISAHTGIATQEVRALQDRVITQWSKQKAITELRDEIAEVLTDNGGVLTALETAEALLLRRGCLQEGDLRDRWAQAVARAAVDTELARQSPRWIIRRIGRRLVLADNTQGSGEALADYAEALGQLADECAAQPELLSPARALEKVRNVPAPEAALGLSNARLLRLAAAASQGAALSSRAEFYPIGMSAARALELAQGALLGSHALSVQAVQDRVRGRYPAAEPLPGRPSLDTLMQALDMGFAWNGQYTFQNGSRGAYCLPSAGLTSLVGSGFTTSHFSTLGDGQGVTLQDIQALDQSIRTAIESARFLALTVRPRHYEPAGDRLVREYGLRRISFDALLLSHLHRVCDGMARPPNWSLVLRADAADPGARDWQNLQRLIARALPAMTEEIQAIDEPILLTEPGLLARYGLVNTWLNDLRRHLLEGAQPPALILLIATDAQHDGARIDGVTVPHGAGTREWARIPALWLDSPAA